MYRILIRARNAQDEIKKCLQSCRLQTYIHWKAYVFLDNPTDDTARIAKIQASKDHRINIYENDKHLGLAHNLWKGIKHIRKVSEPEDVVCILDGDDYLDKKALEIIDHEYKKRPELCITHGSFYRIDKRRVTKTSGKYPKGCCFRSHPWRGSHLKTVKCKLLNHYKKEWLQDIDSRWYPGATDVAFMVPLLELAGHDRVKFIKKITYYWKYTKYNTNGRNQLKSHQKIRKMPKQERLEVV